MSKFQKKAPVSPQTRDDAVKIARATQRPGQTKEQTRLIAQGVQKGIEQYKKQQKAKARELDRKIKKADRQLQQPEVETLTETREVLKYRQHWLPWTLLGLSWAGMAVYLLMMP